jgi:glycosyltransferase involved in cell wall biosynthesis
MAEALIGVVTALGRREYDLLELAGQSLAGLADVARADHAGLEWVICLDGLGVDQEQIVRDCVSRSAVPARVVSNSEEGGPGPARNAALAHITAPWLLTLDSDDTIRPDGVIALLDALDGHPDAAWAAGRCDNVDPHGNLLWAGPEDYFQPGLIEVTSSFWQAKLATGGVPFICNATLGSTAAVRAVGGWPLSKRDRAEDTALWAVLTSRYLGVWVPAVGYNNRRRPASVTHQAGFRDLDERLDEIAEMVAAGSTNWHRVAESRRSLRRAREPKGAGGVFPNERRPPLRSRVAHVLARRGRG